MQSTVPLIYAPDRTPVRLNVRSRAFALGVALACLAVLMTAVALVPSGAGIGTHTALGMQPCGFERTTGLPCGTCGMTTSFSWFVRARFLQSAYVQPAGFVLALLTAMTFCGALYVALTGRPAYRLLRQLPVTPTVIVCLVFFFAAWGWKIFLRLKGLDG